MNVKDLAKILSVSFLLLPLLFAENGFAEQNGNTNQKVGVTANEAPKQSPSSPGGLSFGAAVIPNSGNVTSNISIQVPPGRNGMQPSISLSYNSSKKNGWIGVGWYLKGVDQIQRSTNGLNYSGDDFVHVSKGNSTELAFISSLSDGGREYRAKIEGAFIRYIKYVDHWKLIDPRGTHYTFGGSASSKQTNPSGTFSWGITSATDTFGNSLSYTYTNDSGYVYLDKIEYAGGNSLQFKRKNTIRPDAPPMYTTKHKIENRYLLDRVEVYGNGQLARRYQLGYSESPSTGRSTLATVDQYGKNNTATLPTISFTPQAPNNKFDKKHWTVDLADMEMDQNNKVISGDFNGDGMIDIAYTRPKWGGWYVLISTGSGFLEKAHWTVNLADMEMDGDNKIISGDFNGDGKTDIAYTRPKWGGWYVLLSTGFGFEGKAHWTVDLADMEMDQNNKVISGDFNGDGKTDIAYTRPKWGGWWVLLSTGSAFEGKAHWTVDLADMEMDQHNKIVSRDFNGDGKTDIAYTRPKWGGWWVLLSTGSAFEGKAHWTVDLADMEFDEDNKIISGDFNGDGKIDIAYTRPKWGGWYVLLSTGSAFIKKDHWAADLNDMERDSLNIIVAGDINGDGKTDIAYTRPKWGGWWAFEPEKTAPDLIKTITNGIGGTTTYEYEPSTIYPNFHLPYVVQTVAAVTADDGRGLSATTNYWYEGGFHDIPTKEFRGFSFSKVTGPEGNRSETWFFQDDLYKGRAFVKLHTGANGRQYTRTDLTFSKKDLFTGVSFPYIMYSDTNRSDGTGTSTLYAKYFDYDLNGNLTRKINYGLTPDDDIDQVLSYEYNNPNFVSMPTKIVATGCKVANIDPNTNTTCAPGGGGLDPKTYRTESTYYLTGKLKATEIGPMGGLKNPKTSYEYDPYGNLNKTTDPRGVFGTIEYDAISNIYPEKKKNALGELISSTQWDKTLGVVESVQDQNLNTFHYYYDEFGRKEKETDPYNMASTYGSESYEYLYYGTPGTQKVLTRITEETGTAKHIQQESYFDGFGRVFKTKTEGPEGKIIIQDTEYNLRGAVFRTSLPYFEGASPAGWTEHTYDGVGRVIRVVNPDKTESSVVYNKELTTYFNENNGKKVHETDAHGNLVKVYEYWGPGDNDYHVTNYKYDVLGNLTEVEDAENNKTIIEYNDFGRKIKLTDPDMGTSWYTYLKNGLLETQKDAEGQVITFEYDNDLNRLSKQLFSSGKEVNFTYGETFSTNAKGRVTTMSDASGSEKYYYDKLGRVEKLQKTIISATNSTTYEIQQSYDAMGREKSITYPDGNAVTYDYDAGSLQTVSDSSTTFATFSGYNEAGMFGNALYGNEVNSTYQYYPRTHRPFSITTTTSSTTVALLNVTYEYDRLGNIKRISDLIEQESPLPAENLGYIYDPDRPHVLAHLSKDAVPVNNTDFVTDKNGNMKSSVDPATGKNRVFTYDVNNMLTKVTDNGQAVLHMVYDGNGARVRKYTGTGASTDYVGGIYECDSSGCASYIFANGTRIAVKKNGGTYYLHQDHQGSTRVVTDQFGNNIQNIKYSPYGKIVEEEKFGPYAENYKYTSQLHDEETDLDYYNARYYDPRIGRFITADTIIPDPTNPQSFNRYAYVYNNPINFTDPTGHWPSWNDIKKVGKVVGGAAMMVGGVALCVGSSGTGCSVGAQMMFAGGSILAGKGVTELGGQANVEAEVGRVNSDGSLGIKPDTVSTNTDVSGNDLSSEGRQADIENTINMMPLDAGGLGYSTRPPFLHGGVNEQAFNAPGAAVGVTLGYLTAYMKGEKYTYKNSLLDAVSGGFAFGAFGNAKKLYSALKTYRQVNSRFSSHLKHVPIDVRSQAAQALGHGAMGVGANKFKDHERL